MSAAMNDPRQWLTFVPKTLDASPLYSEWWARAREDREVLALMELLDPNQPLPVTFFMVINYLVLNTPRNLLAQFYPYLQPKNTRPAAEAYPFFRAFVLAHRTALQKLLPTARLQTNEVTRCANLLPAFVLAYQRGGYRALNMLEIGSCAGLNLLWDRYGYRYRNGSTEADLVLGDSQAPVQVHCQLTAAHPFPLGPETALPRVASCQGIEIYPRDIRNEDDMRWVRAAIWPEELERHRTLDAALAGRA